jgi:fructose-1,6-bisphosphatase/inositol monophosphatase family enzyme
MMAAVYYGLQRWWWWRYKMNKQQQQHEASSSKIHDKDEDSTKTYAVPAEITAQASAEMQQIVTLAVDLALQAGRHMVSYCNDRGTLLESRHGDLDISTKTSDEDFCTRVDVENERLITHAIRAAFPSHLVIGEEETGVGDIPRPTKGIPTWIIDPIDGTTNFASGLPLTCVSIGYCNERGQPVMGVVFAPMTDELYVAVRGHGAFCNGVQITNRRRQSTNSSSTTPPTPLNQALVCFELGYPRDPESVKKTVGAVQRLMEHGCRASRQLGSGVLDLCYVATGRLDAVYAGVAGEGWKPWDFCAGYVIIREAGCCMEPIFLVHDQETADDEFDLYSASHICATSRELVQEIRRVITAAPVDE